MTPICCRSGSRFIGLRPRFGFDAFFAELVVNFVDGPHVEKLRCQRLRGIEELVDSPLHLRIVAAK